MLFVLGAYPMLGILFFFFFWKIAQNIESILSMHFFTILKISIDFRSVFFILIGSLCFAKLQNFDAILSQSRKYCIIHLMLNEHYGICILLRFGNILDWSRARERCARAHHFAMSNCDWLTERNRIRPRVIPNELIWRMWMKYTCWENEASRSHAAMLSHTQTARTQSAVIFVAEIAYSA